MYVYRSGWLSTAQRIRQGEGTHRCKELKETQPWEHFLTREKTRAWSQGLPQTNWGLTNTSFHNLSQFPQLKQSSPLEPWARKSTGNPRDRPIGTQRVQEAVLAHPLLPPPFVPMAHSVPCRCFSSTYTRWSIYINPLNGVSWTSFHRQQSTKVQETEHWAHTHSWMVEMGQTQDPTQAVSSRAHFLVPKKSLTI